MFRDELLKKIKNEQALTSAEESLLDEHLQTESQQLLKSVVSAVPDEEVSMTWRSNLNGRLLELGKSVEKRRRSLLIWRPALGLGLAGLLALVLVLKPYEVDPPAANVATMSVEATLLDEHMEAVRATEIAGAGLASYEARPTPVSAGEDYYDWQRVDFEAL